MEPKRLSKLEYGSVHGRFQPLHNDHLHYILEAKIRCDYLWIGITKYDISIDHLNPLGRHRERPEANPLTYYERISIIRNALRDEKIEQDSFGFVPFPIETPMILSDFIPKDIICFTTICEEWNREKIQLLKDFGYQVEVLWERVPKIISGSEIREAIAAGRESWKELVPKATERAVVKLELIKRLRDLKALAK